MAKSCFLYLCSSTKLKQFYPQMFLANSSLFSLRCVDKFCCSSCDKRLGVKTKFYEVDLKPVCKKCYEK